MEILTLINTYLLFIIVTLPDNCYSLVWGKALPFLSHIFFLPMFYLVIPSNTIYQLSPLFNAFVVSLGRNRRNF